ncbi:uncharacterized protein LOC117339317 [Pecten maximus]|uniref:uncharacterized protein LOC117339317 n=1 Tax=Pecten maximus TaxID=6579 RepID=UPI0014586D9D|nr:uncharacterized protein LOC117339317 [Pecten maximus]
MSLTHLIIVIIVLDGVICLPRRFLFQDDRCAQNPENGQTSIRHPDNAPADDNVDMHCKNGSINWNYPIGTINLHFNDECDFTVCFLDEIGAGVLELSDITSGVPKMFPTLFHGDDPEKEYCLGSVNSNLVIKMHAPFHAYMASFSYQLRY